MMKKRIAMLMAAAVLAVTPAAMMAAETDTANVQQMPSAPGQAPQMNNR